MNSPLADPKALGENELSLLLSGTHKIPITKLHILLGITLVCLALAVGIPMPSLLSDSAPLTKPKAPLVELIPEANTAQMGSPISLEAEKNAGQKIPDEQKKKDSKGTV